MLLFAVILPGVLHVEWGDALTCMTTGLWQPRMPVPRVCWCMHVLSLESGMQTDGGLNAALLLGMFRGIIFKQQKCTESAHLGKIVLCFAFTSQQHVRRALYVMCLLLSTELLSAYPMWFSLCVQGTGATGLFLYRLVRALLDHRHSEAIIQLCSSPDPLMRYWSCRMPVKALRRQVLLELVPEGSKWPVSTHLLMSGGWLVEQEVQLNTGPLTDQLGAMRDFPDTAFAAKVSRWGWGQGVSGGRAWAPYLLKTQGRDVIDLQYYLFPGAHFWL